MHAFHRRLNYPNRIRTSTPGGGCHGYRAPLFVFFFITRARLSGSGDASFQRCPVKYCVAAPSGSCEAPRLSNRRRLCWPRPPLTNLGWRQQRALADLNQSFKVSTPPSFAPARISGTPPPTASPIWHPSFFLRQGSFFAIDYFCFELFFYCVFSMWLLQTEQVKMF